MSGAFKVVDSTYFVDLSAPDWDINALPHGIQEGGNRLGLYSCPFCNAKGHEVLLVGGERRRFFLFRDQLSAAEYQLSGLCQGCQDKTFVVPGEDKQGEFIEPEPKK